MVSLTWVWRATWPSGKGGLQVHAWLVRTLSRFGRRPRAPGSSLTKRLRGCSHCLMTLISPSAPTYCSAHGVVGPNLSLPLVHAYFLPFSLALYEKNQRLKFIC